MKFSENVKTFVTGALKHHNGLLRDNLRNSPEKKALLREGLKRHGICMWKIIVRDLRQNVATGGVCPPWHPKEFQKSQEPETKVPWRETLSVVDRYLKFENYSSASHSIHIRIGWDISLRYRGYKQMKVGFIQGLKRPRRRKILKTQEKRELGEQEGDLQISFYVSNLLFHFL